jgi:hypothetical protein
MSRLRFGSAAALITVLVALFGVAPGRSAHAASAASAASYTVTVRAVYLRDTAASSAAITYAVYRGKTYPILGRSADSAWLRLDVVGARRGTWILAAFGAIAGPLDAVPAEFGDGVSPAPGADAPPDGAQSLTLTSGAYIRAGPSWSAAKVALLDWGQVFTITGRDASSRWLRVLLPAEAWLPVGYGKLSGAVSALPVAGAVASPIPTPSPTSAPVPTEPAASAGPGLLPSWIPALTPHMRQVYASARRRGLNPASFSVAGDCNSEGNIFTQLIAYDLIDLTNTPYLRSTARYFKDSTFRKSMAVAGGFSAATIMDPMWSFPEYCRLDEGPFACELRTSKSSIVFIGLGTGDHFQWQDFEAHYRAPIEYALKAGVLPVLVTKVDALESQEGGATQGYINDVIRRLGAEYDVPVVDMWKATRDLRDGGLTDEPGHDFHLNAEAIGVHVISTLQLLYRLFNGV